MYKSTTIPMLNTVVDPGGAPSMCQWDPIFSFSHVSTKKHPCRRSAPPNGLVPPMGNPGSAAEIEIYSVQIPFPY